MTLPIRSLLAHSVRRAAGMPFAVLCAITAITATPAHAAAQYIDPGSASVLWQLILAGVFGVIFSVRSYLLLLGRALLRRWRRSSNQSRGDE